MNLVIDSGSSKTVWRLQHDDGGTVDRFTVGLNPHFTPDSVVERCIDEVMGATPFEGEIFFYGAGCGDSQSRQRYKQIFEHCIPGSRAVVEDDLTGACRALLGDRPGLAGILGTGSNACYYDGTAVADRICSTGYVLGDEGSGNHIGRRLWKDYWAGRMPGPLAEQFKHLFPLSLPEFLQRLYHEPCANRFLASAAPFAAQHRQEPYMHSLLVGCMTAYIEEQVLPLGKRRHTATLSLTGSVAAHFRHELDEAATQAGIAVAHIMAQPIEGLAAYHRKREQHT